MNFRDFLVAQGLSESDIAQAVQEARRATRVLHLASGASVQVFTRAADKFKHPKLKAAMMGTAIAVQHFHNGLGEILRKR